VGDVGRGHRERYQHLYLPQEGTNRYRLSKQEEKEERHNKETPAEKLKN
jgi:hypothetical protein